MTSLTPEAFYNAVDQNIQQDMQACNALLALLQKEREQLIARQVDELDGIIQEKTQWLAHLEISAKTRSGWLTQTPLNRQTDPAEAWQALLASLNKPDLAERWQHLKTLLQSCRDQNEINGKLIARSQTTFTRLVNILRGQDTVTPLYTGKGGRSEGYSKHTLGQA